MRAGSLYRALLAPDDLMAPQYRTEAPSRTPADRVAELEKIATRLSRSHKFEVAVSDALQDENLHQTAATFFRSGHLRMPFPECYFEFNRCLPGRPGWLMAVLVVETAPYTLRGDLFTWNERHWCDPRGVIRSGAFFDPPEGIELGGEYDAEMIEAMQINGLRAMQYVVDIALFMSTKHVAYTSVPGLSTEQNSKRMGEGGTPLFDYHVVKIDRAARISRDLGGTHASPRLHWRRGHLRNSPDGGRIPVKPHLVGLSEKGFVAKHYVVPPSDKRGDSE